MTTPRSIAFIGSMAAGKSRAVRAAAAVLGTEPLDVDDELAAELGEPIADFFGREGEPAFRALEERKTLELLSRGGVVALGGGAVENPAIRAALAGHLAVWCQISLDDAWERARRKPEKRPLARNRETFAERFAAREPIYEQVATAVLPRGGDRTPALAAPWLDLARRTPGARLAWARTKTVEYPALIAPGALTGLPLVDGPHRWHILADPNALAHHRDVLPEAASLHEVGGSEEVKTMTEAERALGALAASGAIRDDGVVAFGGGVAGDIAGFCAAVYQRGIDVVQAPTTLVAQVDSAYGGKTGVDLASAKNYVGAFHQPRAVLADPGWLSTLPPAELSAGFAEVVKTALLAGGGLWERVRAIESLDPAGLGDVVFACARVKLDVVAADERDTGVRATLNLGHTVGHAIEAATGYRHYRHGEAIALGLLAVLRVSGADELRDEVQALLRRTGLPTTLDAGVDVDAVIDAVGRDKKRDADGVGFVLLDRPGAATFGQRVEADTLRASVNELQA